MDQDGYPDEADLDVFINYPCNKLQELEKILRDCNWCYYGSAKTIEDEDYIRIELSTGGWSGNEDIIGALASNVTFWLMHWYSSQRGGHYVFGQRKIK